MKPLRISSLCNPNCWFSSLSWKQMAGFLFTSLFKVSQPFSYLEVIWLSFLNNKCNIFYEMMQNLREKITTIGNHDLLTQNDLYSGSNLIGSLLNVIVLWQTQGIWLVGLNTANFFLGSWEMSSFWALVSSSTKWISLQFKKEKEIDTLFQSRGFWVASKILFFICMPILQVSLVCKSLLSYTSIVLVCTYLYVHIVNRKAKKWTPRIIKTILKNKVPFQIARLIKL